MKLKYTLLALSALFLLNSCNDRTASSDEIQRAQQEKILKEGTAQIGMPAIKNFREKKILKEILELRDQEGLLTYTYIVAEQTGALIFLGQSIGYGIPAATQFTSPQKTETVINHGVVAVPQADPNGLFSPASAEGTWVLLKDPHSDKVSPIYCEPRIIVSSFPLK